MLITIVGIPWAIMWGVRWTLAIQAVMLEGVSWREAMRSSSNLVRHRWWRAALTNAVLAFLSSATGPLVGLVLLILLNVSQEITNGVSATIYAIAYPIAVTGMTLLYFQFRDAVNPALIEPEPASPAAPAPEPPATPGGDVAPEPA
jgi:hypothetical protein